MANYLMFGTYSAEGIKGVSAKRTKKATQIIKDNGGKYRDGYALLGDVDLVLVVDFPNTESAMKASVGLSQLLGVNFTTAAAGSVEKFEKLIG